MRITYHSIVRQSNQYFPHNNADRIQLKPYAYRCSNKQRILKVKYTIGYNSKKIKLKLIIIYVCIPRRCTNANAVKVLDQSAVGTHITL